MIQVWSATGEDLAANLQDDTSAFRWEDCNPYSLEHFTSIDLNPAKPTTGDLLEFSFRTSAGSGDSRSGFQVKNWTTRKLTTC